MNTRQKIIQSTIGFGSLSLKGIFLFPKVWFSAITNRVNIVRIHEFLELKRTIYTINFKDFLDAGIHCWIPDDSVTSSWTYLGKRSSLSFLETDSTVELLYYSIRKFSYLYPLGCFSAFGHTTKTCGNGSKLWKELQMLLGRKGNSIIQWNCCGDCWKTMRFLQCVSAGCKHRHSDVCGCMYHNQLLNTNTTPTVAGLLS